MFSVPSGRYKSAVHAQFIREREMGALRSALWVEEVDGGFRRAWFVRLGQGRSYTAVGGMAAASTKTLAATTWVREFLEIFAHRYEPKVVTPFRLYLAPDIVRVLKEPSLANGIQVEAEATQIRKLASKFESLCFLCGGAEQVRAGYDLTNVR